MTHSQPPTTVKTAVFLIGAGFALALITWTIIALSFTGTSSNASQVWLRLFFCFFPLHEGGFPAHPETLDNKADRRSRRDASSSSRAPSHPRGPVSSFIPPRHGGRICLPTPRNPASPAIP